LCLPSLRSRQEDLLHQVTALESKKAILNMEIQRLRNLVYANNEIVRKQIEHLRKLNRKLKMYVSHID
jgi:uncharacterized coiled-coil protein SlyX